MRATHTADCPIWRSEVCECDSGWSDDMPEELPDDIDDYPDDDYEREAT